MSLAIGVDIGGTRTKSGLVNINSGEVLNMVLQPTEKNKEDVFLEQLQVAIQQHQAIAKQMNSSISGIGFGVPSFVSTNGIVDSTYGFLPFMEDYPLVAIIENKFELNCCADNDARVVALGEARYGKGKGYARLLVLTLGTGLGVGFMKNGRFDDDFPFGHMGGHIKITDNDQVCYCGKTGCLESLVSSAGVEYSGKEMNWKENYPDIPLTAEAIFKAAKAGNKEALFIVEKLIHYLHTGLHNYINLLAPDCIVIGGGMSKSIAPYLETLDESDYLKPYKNYKTQITVSELQEDAGILGAAALLNQ